MEAPSGSGARELSPPCFVNSEFEEVKAKQMLSNLLPRLKNRYLSTDALARSILQVIESGLVYEFKNIETIEELSLPYQTKKILETLCHLEPLEVLKHESRINCMIEITKKTFDFYFKANKQIKNLTPTIAIYLDENSKQPNEAYVIFFSTTRWFHLLKKKTIHPDEKEEVFECYHFHEEPSAIIKAPFHHEAQTYPAACGLHALNAYLGFHYFSLRKLAELLHNRSKFLHSPDEEVEKEKFESSFNYQEFKQKFKGFDTDELEWVIDELADTKAAGVTYKAKSFAGGFTESEMFPALSEEKLLETFAKIDRFIMGIGKVEGHFLTFCKDANNAWWRVDSLLRFQDGYETNEALVDFLKKEYKEYLLHFIIPDFEGY